MSIQSKVQQITGLAMDITANNKALVFVRYNAHVNTLDVDANPVGTVYQKDVQQERLIDYTVYLTPKENRTEQQIINELDAVIAQLNELKAQREIAA